MAVCVSVMNMKGGVGKTTLATQLAWYATQIMDKRTLLIDLDPQANASQCILGPTTYVNHLKTNKLTVANVFEEFTPTGQAVGSPQPLDPRKVIVTRVKYTDGSKLDIVPSRLELAWTLRNPTGKDTLLPRFVSKIESEYDLIFVDCSPTDSILTDAAYHCSRYLLVPIRLEFLASIGFPLLNRSITAFKTRYDDKVMDVCGLVYNDFNRNDKREHRIAREDVEAQARKHNWHVFKNGVPHSDSYYRAARDGMPIEDTKGTHAKVKNEFARFASEFFRGIGL